MTAATPATQALHLTVWFDGDCGFCTRVAKWLQRQPKFVAVRCVEAQTATSHACPLNTQELLDKITVTASDGAIYRGSNAWITVLWALRNYRRWSLRFARKAWRPWADDLFATITGLARLTKRRRRPNAARRSR
jgi:predicted DCC family thiol-disulfide oxidoreductase YuxK